MTMARHDNGSVVLDNLLEGIKFGGHIKKGQPSAPGFHFEHINIIF